ncbi:MAG: DUF309 domain-containing protein [Planctomycetales bacterium]|nr:DUF309 domain-containing protein [Planctomycetales bacterium]
MIHETLSPTPPDSPPPRFIPERNFPAYSYVPGRHPHPISDPVGHSFGETVGSVDSFEPSRWRESTTFCFGLDLFNYGYYWEAHEQWEAVWLAVGRTGTIADMLKGLIKLAAAGVKLRERRADGMARHARRAAELFNECLATNDDAAVAADFEFELAAIIRRAEEIARQATELVTAVIEPDTAFLPLLLLPNSPRSQ